MAKLRYGSLIYAEVPDPAGRNPKRRPLLIVTPSDALETGREIFCVAITSQIPDPLTEDMIELPWSRHCHPRTKLNRPLIARCDWIEKITVTDDLTEIGYATDSVLERIEHRLRQLDDK